MSNEEMRKVLADYLAKFRAWSYAKLADRVESDRHSHECLEHVEQAASDGTPYQMEFQAIWDDKPGGDIRVIGSLSAEPQKRLLGFLPIYIPHATDNFIMRSDGRFVDE